MSRALKVYLGDLTYTNRLNRNTRHVPKNIGFIASYVTKVFGDQIDVRLFKEPQALLDAARDVPPDVLGLSFYLWNTDLNHTVTKILRGSLGNEVVVLWGGPSVDSDREEQRRLFDRFPEVDAFIPNEGELGMAALLRRMLSSSNGIWADPIDGNIYLREGSIVRGKDIGLSLDLSELPSPYLSGILDPFIHGDYLPGVQTSRLCPYTCSFCVSGKSRGKLRAFPIEQVEEEIAFVCRSFADRPYLEMHINDENFGIIPRDADISEYILRCREKWGFPQNIFYYHDKRLTETTRRIALNLAPLSANGIAIPLQTENPEALINAKRKVVTPEKIAEVIGWAAEGDLPATTELIFGLPGETAETFCDSLDRALTRGFDSVLCNTLFIIDGIELNRAAERSALNIKTRFRKVRENYGMVEGNFCAEVEEVVVSTDTFDENDFLDIRKISMMFYVCFNMRFHYWLISYLKNQGLSITRIMREFLNPEIAADEQGRAFALEFEKAALGELCDDADKLRAELKKSYVANGNDVGDAAQLNILYGARLIYEEGAWVDEALMAIAARHLGEDANGELAVCRFLIGLYRSERLDLKEMKTPVPLKAHWDVLAWRKDKFQRPLSDYALSDPQEIEFSVKPAFNVKFDRLREDFDIAEDTDSYVNVLLNIGARSDLLLQMEYA